MSKAYGHRSGYPLWWSDVPGCLNAAVRTPAAGWALPCVASNRRSPLVFHRTHFHRGAPLTLWFFHLPFYVVNTRYERAIDQHHNLTIILFVRRNPGANRSLHGHHNNQLAVGSYDGKFLLFSFLIRNRDRDEIDVSVCLSLSLSVCIFYHLMTGFCRINRLSQATL